MGRFPKRALPFGFRSPSLNPVPLIEERNSFPSTSLSLSRPALPRTHFICISMSSSFLEPSIHINQTTRRDVRPLHNSRLVHCHGSRTGFHHRSIEPIHRSASNTRNRPIPIRRGCSPTVGMEERICRAVSCSLSSLSLDINTMDGSFCSSHPNTCIWCDGIAFLFVVFVFV